MPADSEEAVRRKQMEDAQTAVQKALIIIESAKF